MDEYVSRASSAIYVRRRTDHWFCTRTSPNMMLENQIYVQHGTSYSGEQNGVVTILNGKPELNMEPLMERVNTFEGDLAIVQGG